MSEQCLFCKIVQGEISCHKVYEDKDILAFLDIHPVNPGHTLVIPKQHTTNLLETTDEDLAKITQVIKKITPVILETVGASGFNIGVNTGSDAGQVIFHTHFHIMPRFEGDWYELWHGKEVKSEELAIITKKITNFLNNDL